MSQEIVVVEGYFLFERCQHTCIQIRNKIKEDGLCFNMLFLRSRQVYYFTACKCVKLNQLCVLLQHSFGHKMIQRKTTYVADHDLSHLIQPEKLKVTVHTFNSEVSLSLNLKFILWGKLQFLQKS
jgi:hypothetical protein